MLLRGACDTCHRSKERCQYEHDKESCLRCLRLDKICHPRTKKRFGRPPRVDKFDNGESIIFSLSGKHVNLKPAKPVTHIPSDRSSQATSLESEPKSYGTPDHEPKLILTLPPKLQNSSLKQVAHILTTKTTFFTIHRHWLIIKSQSPHYQHTMRHLFSHSPLILANGYQSVLDLLVGPAMTFNVPKSTIDYTKGAKCLGELARSYGSLKSVEDAAVVLMLGQILFVYNVLIQWPCTHLIIRNTLITTREWFPRMLREREWDPATLTPVFVDVVQCLVRREVPVLQLSVEGRVVVDRFLGVSSSLLPILYDLSVCSYRVKMHAPAPVPLLCSTDRQEVDDDAYSTVERQILAWEPILPPDFHAKYTPTEVSALLAQSRMYKTAALLLTHRLRHPLGIHDQTGKHHAQSLLHGLSSFTRSLGDQDALGIGSNFLFLMITLELPEQGNSLIRILESFTFGPRQYTQILEFAEDVRRQRGFGFDGLWFDMAEDGLARVSLP